LDLSRRQDVIHKRIEVGENDRFHRIVTLVDISADDTTASQLDDGDTSLLLVNQPALAHAVLGEPLYAFVRAANSRFWRENSGDSATRTAPYTSSIGFSVSGVLK
jgi:hypothetical protein